MGLIKPADRFYRVYQRGREIRKGWVVVTKVGRKWAEFSREIGSPTKGRFDMETFEIDAQRHFAVAGRVFRSEEEHGWHVREEKLWKDFREQIDRNFRKPNNVSDVAIFKAADALGIKLERN